MTSRYDQSANVQEYRVIQDNIPIRDVTKTTTPSRFVIINGTTGNFAYPCYYIIPPKGVRIHKHGYKWWNDERITPPVPNIQNEMPRWMREVLDKGGEILPIHLTAEGYTSASVSIDDYDHISGLTVKASIDKDQDWVVRVGFNVNMQTVIHDPFEVKYTIRVEGTVNGQHRKDVVSTGTILILPAQVKEVPV